jgi:hypothetical protein
MNTEENEILWGDRLVKMMIFFDNVRCIPENRQRGKICSACGRQAIYAQLNDRDKPFTYFCKKDVWEARRKLRRKARHQLLHTCTQTSTH